MEESLANGNKMDVEGFGMSHGVRYNLLLTVGTYANIVCESVEHRGDTSHVSPICKLSGLFLNRLNWLVDQSKEVKFKWLVVGFFVAIAMELNGLQGKICIGMETSTFR